MFFLDRLAQRPLIAFLRTQRSYNKRRYAKARVVSRPSFVFGILLSCFLVGAFWGGTNYNLDWLTVQLICLDIDFILYLGYFVCFLYLFRLRGFFHSSLTANTAKVGVHLNTALRAVTWYL
jgi:hypothetical protein